MQTRSWDDPAGGGKKYRTEIVADTMQFGPRASGAGATGGYTPSTASKGAQSPAHEPLETIEYPQEDINPDDIPF